MLNRLSFPSLPSFSLDIGWQKLTAIILTAIIVGLTLVGGVLIGYTDKGIWAVAGILAIVVSAVVIVRPEIGLYTLVVFTYLNLSDVFKAAFNIPSLIQPLIGLLFVSVLINRIVLNHKPLIFRGTEFAIFAYGMVIVASMFVADDRGLAGAAVGEWIKNFIILIMILQLAGDENVWKSMQWALIVSAGFLAALTCYQVFIAHFNNDFFGLVKSSVNQITNGVDDTRVTGPLDDPNFFGQILVMTVPFIAYRVLTDKQRMGRIIAGICLALVLLSILSTYSRGAFIALMVVTALIVIERRYNPLIVGLIVAFIVTVVPPLLPANYLNRIMTLDTVSQDATLQTEQSFRGRYSEANAAIDMFLDHPLLGVGVGNYPVYYLQYSDQLGLDSRLETRQAHNYYLEIAAEKGIIGLTAFFVMLLIVFRGTFRARRQVKSVGRSDLLPWIAGIQLSLVAYLTTSLFLHDDYSRYFWLVVAFAASCSVMSRALVNREKFIQPDALPSDQAEF